MSDIFREVDEEVRREQLKKLWERYGTYIVALAILFVAAVGAWRGYLWWQGKQAAEAGTAYYAAMVLSETDKHQEAEAAFAKIAKEGTSTYRALGAMRAAAELGQRDPKAAVEALDALVKDRALDPVMQDLAALRAGYLLVDTASQDEIRRRIEPLSAADRPFRHSARLLLALAAWRANDAAGTKRIFELVLVDQETPPSIRSQIEMLTTMLNPGGTS